MTSKPLRDSLAEEARYGLADIRAAWERAWFGEPVTPSTWHQVGSGEPVSTSDPAPRDALYGKQPEREDWDAKCRAFFEPADTARSEESGPARNPDPIDR